METWFLILLSFCVPAIISSLLFLILRRNDKKLPPGPSFFSSLLLLLTSSITQFQLTKLRSKYGPLLTISFASHPVIFIGSHSLAHELLIQKGALFSDRPKVFRFCSISSASYGPTWRLLRRNLASDFLHPPHIKSYSWARKQVLGNLIRRLQEQQEAVGIIKVIDHFQYAMFSLFLLMCFGEKLEERCINDIVSVQRRVLSTLSSKSFNMYTVSPRLFKLLFRKAWKNYDESRKEQKQLFIPLIKSRIESVKSKPQSVGGEQIMAYVDTLVKLQLPEEKTTNRNGGNLTLKEMVSLCSEFLHVGTGTTFNALQWTMANLVKYPHIQSKLFSEIVAVVGLPPPTQPGVEPKSFINEDDFLNMPYLKAVVLESLRRHPPGHLLLFHKVTKEVEVQGYKIPQGATINFMMAEMGWDPKVWDEPMEFRPERFMSDDGVFDISGSKGIKMMPFGAGRRMCPGSDLALLHLESFVANLIWYFDWSVPDGYHVDLSEEVDFTIKMKNPLQARVSSRTKT